MLLELIQLNVNTDKALMLDEIIEYVKFLQLQVKVLSMSRLGAAGAVVPLITKGQQILQVWAQLELTSQI
uniref:Uncharacterized protein n=1 Tax=Nelumbo nucifera TaxID=4432 RepID=A0A822XCF0_NELNU|nr:TPA_asm: hypothetical protein HUJ06_020557 [Nelumbo nucifera]